MIEKQKTEDEWSGYLDPRTVIKLKNEGVIRRASVAVELYVVAQIDAFTRQAKDKGTCGSEFYASPRHIANQLGLEYGTVYKALQRSPLFARDDANGDQARVWRRTPNGQNVHGHGNGQNVQSSGHGVRSNGQNVQSGMDTVSSGMDTASPLKKDSNEVLSERSQGSEVRKGKGKEVSDEPSSHSPDPFPFRPDTTLSTDSDSKTQSGGGEVNPSITEVCDEMDARAYHLRQRFRQVLLGAGRSPALGNENIAVNTSREIIGLLVRTGNMNDDFIIGWLDHYSTVLHGKRMESHDSYITSLKRTYPAFREKYEAERKRREEKAQDEAAAASKAYYSALEERVRLKHEAMRQKEQEEARQKQEALRRKQEEEQARIDEQITALAGQLRPRIAHLISHDRSACIGHDAQIDSACKALIKAGLSLNGNGDVDALKTFLQGHRHPTMTTIFDLTSHGMREALEAIKSGANVKGGSSD